MPKQLMLADLARSGLTPEDAAAAGFRYLTAAETAALGPNFSPLPSLYIPYYTAADPAAPASAAPKWPPFFRVRYLATPNGFNRVTGEKPIRYMQPANSGLCAYWPRAAPWRTIITDPTQPIIITEGEKKALKACLAGHPTVGLGEVWSFQSTKLGYTLLPDLQQVNWVRRKVVVIYDSDACTNPQVMGALWALAEELARHGALPYIATLSNIYEDDTRKTGLDDYLAAGQDLAPVLAGAQPLTLARALWGINKLAVYVRDPGLIIQRKDNLRLSPAAFKEHAYAALNYAEYKLTPDGKVTLDTTSNPAAAWVRWPLRATVARLTYKPGAPQEVDGEYNVWSGWGAEPKKGTVAPFLTLLGHLFSDAPPEDQAWFLRWLAYPLQHPGTKLFTAAVLYGRRHGTGKSWIGLTMGRIYGRNFSEISQGDLESGFNEWAVGKQFVLGDDVTGSDRRAHADQLKKMITQHEIRINQKYVPSYSIPDCINYYFTSNQPDAFFLEDDDRRYFVHEVTAAPLPLEFYRDYGAWLADGGAAALFDYLLRLDLKDFSPTAPALRTAAKAAMTLDSKGDLGEWVARLLTDPDALLRCGGVPLPGDLFTNRQLLAVYDPTGQHRVTANGLGRELKRAGVVQVLRGATVRTSGGVDRYYALRNAEQWRGAGLAKVQAHIEAAAAPAAPKKPKY